MKFMNQDIIKMDRGRPSVYDSEIVDRLCERIATTSDSLKTICKDEEYPDVATVFRWLRTKEDFRDQYARAKAEQAELLVEEMLEIADETIYDDKISDTGSVSANSEWINRSRLRVDTRKWIASKLKPKKYGDKLDITSDNKPLTVNFKPLDE